MSFFFVTLGVFIIKFWHIPSALTLDLSTINATVLNVNKTFTTLNDTIAKINAKNGTLDTANADLKDLRLSLDNINSAALDERFYFEKTMPGITSRINQLLDSANITLTTTTALENNISDQTTKTAEQFDPLIEQFKSNLTHLDQIETNPDLAKTFKNVDSMTDSGQQILADGAYETHKLTHPDKKKLTFWGGVWLAIQAIHKVEPPLF
jgi:hypothetical protein